MIWDQFKDLYTTNKKIQKLFLKTIDEVIKDVDYSNINRYKFDTNKNGRLGVYVKLFNKWSWSWLNTVNTNYTCLYLIVDYLNKKYTKKITKDWFSNNPEECVEYFKQKLYENRNDVFKPGSEIFKKMFFATQRSWNDGLISSISSLITIGEFYKIKSEITFERGQEDDMIKGTDMFIEIDGVLNRCQHKLSDLRLIGDFYFSKRFIYNEQTYRDNLDLITIESDNKIYLFENTKNTELCRSINNEGFNIHKSLLKNVMKKENDQVMKLLKDLNILCGGRNIIFSIERNEKEENYFEEEKIGNQIGIRLFLNNFNDVNLYDMLSNQLNKLQ